MVWQNDHQVCKPHLSALYVFIWFYRSACKLAYADAQKVIDGHVLGDLVVAPEHDASAIAHDIKVLEGLAKQMRTRRFQNGTLSLDPLRLSFKLDDNGLPTDCWQYTCTDANVLIEEFMLLTNVTVAQHVAVHLPEQALLRRHDTPIDRRLVSSFYQHIKYTAHIVSQNSFKERAVRLGYEMDVSSAGALMKSFDAITDPTARRLLELLSFKATHRAKYFCAGMLDIAKYQHYALNVPLYTHFTSPIRRYADVLVHRQLESIIQGGSTYQDLILRRLY
jgi:protein SSD1